MYKTRLWLSRIKVIPLARIWMFKKKNQSLAVINWLNLSPSDFSPNIEKGIAFLLSSIKSGGRFGSTQSTVLTLKALTRYA